MRCHRHTGPGCTHLGDGSRARARVQKSLPRCTTPSAHHWPAQTDARWPRDSHGIRRVPSLLPNARLLRCPACRQCAAQREARPGLPDGNRLRGGPLRDPDEQAARRRRRAAANAIPRVGARRCCPVVLATCTLPNLRASIAHACATRPPSAHIAPSAACASLHPPAPRQHVDAAVASLAWCARFPR